MALFPPPAHLEWLPWTCNVEKYYLFIVLENSIAAALYKLPTLNLHSVSTVLARMMDSDAIFFIFNFTHIVKDPACTGMASHVCHRFPQIQNKLRFHYEHNYKFSLRPPQLEQPIHHKLITIIKNWGVAQRENCIPLKCQCILVNKRVSRRAISALEFLWGALKDMGIWSIINTPWEYWTKMKPVLTRP